MRTRPRTSGARSVPAAMLAALLAGCGVLRPVATYRAVLDVHTPNPRTLAEGGHGDPLVPPPGLRWTAVLEGVAQDPLEAAPVRHFALHLDFADALARPGEVRAAPVVERAELVDDTGRRFRCSRALVPDELDAERERQRAARGRPLQRSFTLVFELPTTYRFERVGQATVHWVLRLDGGRELPISTRFEP